MHFPWWYVPVLTAPMLIAIVSIVHVLVSHYAVGGGLFLAVEASHAYRTQNVAYLAYLKRHAKFFVLLTVVFGAITGVGIWWTIGLASPLATRILLQTFVFAWAVEWVFFLVEIVSAFVFYYYWDRLPRKIHTTVLWIYAVSGWASLAIISAITAFMLDPGRLARRTTTSGARSSTARPCRRSSRGPAGPCCSVRSTSICMRRSRSRTPRSRP